MQTQYVSVSPRYGDAMTVLGYTATNTVSATVDELAKAGDVIDAAVEAGANQVSGPSLSVSDQEELYQEALEAAVADARDRAETLAGAAKVSLGGVKTIVEGGGYSPPRAVRGRHRDAAPSRPRSRPASRKSLPRSPSRSSSHRTAAG